MKGFSRIQIALPFAVLLLVVVADTSLYRPRRAKLASLTTELARGEYELLCLVEHADAIQSAKAFLPSDGSGDENSGRGFLSLLSENVERLGLVLKLVEPDREVEDGEFTKRSYHLEVEGGYEEFANFLAYLEELPDLAVIDSFEIRSGLEGLDGEYKASLRFTVTGY